MLPDDPEKALRQLRGKALDGETPRETVPEPPTQRRTEAPAAPAPALRRPRRPARRRPRIAQPCSA